VHEPTMLLLVTLPNIHRFKKKSLTHSNRRIFGGCLSETVSGLLFYCRALSISHLIDQHKMRSGTRV